MLSPIFMAFAIIFIELQDLKEIYHKVQVIEEIDDIYLTFLMARRYEKNILLFKEEQEHISLFVESMRQLRDGIDNIRHDYIIKDKKTVFKTLKDIVTLYDGVMQTLISNKKVVQRLMEDLSILAGQLQQQATNKENTYRLTSYEESYLLYKKPESAKQAMLILEGIVAAEPNLQAIVDNYRTRFSELLANDKTQEETIRKMRQYARDIQKTLLGLTRAERDEIRNKIFRAKLSFALSFIFIVLGVIVVSYLLARGIINTLKEIENAFEDITKDDNSGRYLDITGPQEISSFISAYNRTIADLASARAAYANTIRKLEDANMELMHKQDEIIEKRNMAAMRLLSSEIAHEINNPLSSVISMLYLFYEELPETDDKKELVQLMLKDTSRCQTLIRALADFAKQQPLKLREVNPAELVMEAVDTVKRKLDANVPYLTTYLEQLPPIIVVDPVLIQQVFVNILNNACQFTPVDGIIHIRGYTVEDHVLFSIKDSGKGIPPEVLPNLFEPFFSTRRENGGTGLGLTISKKIVDRHRGKISVESVIGSGSVFKIQLPISQDPLQSGGTCR